MKTAVSAPDASIFSYAHGRDRVRMIATAVMSIVLVFAAYDILSITYASHAFPAARAGTELAAFALVSLGLAVSIRRKTQDEPAYVSISPETLVVGNHRVDRSQVDHIEVHLDLETADIYDKAGERIVSMYFSLIEATDVSRLIESLQKAGWISYKQQIA